VKDTGATKAAAGKMLDSTLDTIGKALKKGDAITFVGFGTFKTSIRKARTARNPRTGEPIKIAKRRVPRFSAGKGLKDLVK
jgi:DNA-binding protein HU-beta